MILGESTFIKCSGGGLFETRYCLAVLLMRTAVVFVGCLVGYWRMIDAFMGASAGRFGSEGLANRVSLGWYNADITHYLTRKYRAERRRASTGLRMAKPSKESAGAI